MGQLEHCKNEGVRHVKELPMLSVVQGTEGYYSFGLNGGPVRDLEEGGIFIAPALARQEIIHHESPKSGQMSARWVLLEVDVNDELPLDFAFSFPVYPDKGLREELSNIMDALFAAPDIVERKIQSYRLIKILLPYGKEKKTDTRIGLTVAFLKEHFRETLTVEEIARVCRSSPSGLYRLFREELGISPIAYLNTLKLSHACLLLEHTSRSVSEIAAECGLCDPYYFSKLFKKKYGLSPVQYRKGLKEKP